MSRELGIALRTARDAKGLGIKAVADECGVTGPAVSQWEAGKTEPTFANLKRVARLLDQDVDHLVALASGRALEGSILPSRQVKIVSPDVQEAPEAPPFAAIRGYAMDIPVWGTAVGGGDGDFRLNGQEVDRVLRPVGLLNTKDVFALRLTNSSMYPAWKDGALLYINPNRNPLIGDDVVVEMHPEEEGEPGKAFMKRLKARGARVYLCEQFNPPCEIEFEVKKVRRLFRVVPMEEALGLS